MCVLIIYDLCNGNNLEKIGNAVSSNTMQTSNAFADKKLAANLKQNAVFDHLYRPLLGCMTMSVTSMTNRRYSKCSGPPGP